MCLNVSVYRVDLKYYMRKGINTSDTLYYEAEAKREVCTII